MSFPPLRSIRLLTLDSEIDHGMFVLNVDLWSADGTREVNLVRHSATSPSISATIPVSYAQVHETSTATFPSTLRSSNPGQQFKYEPGQPYPNTPAAYNPYPGPPQVNPYSQAQAPSQTYGGQQYQPGYGPNGAQPAAYPPQNGYQSPAGVTPVYYTTGAGIHAGAQSQPQQGIDYAPASQPLPSHSSLTSYGGRPFTPADVNIHRMPVSSTQPTGKRTTDYGMVIIFEVPQTKKVPKVNSLPLSHNGHKLPKSSRLVCRTRTLLAQFARGRNRPPPFTS